jgi:hypothetical protein
MSINKSQSSLTLQKHSSHSKKKAIAVECKFIYFKKKLISIYRFP